jgi:Fe-S cluster assembly iron-binding protein IscA
MLTVTPTARTRLSEMLEGRPDHVAARIVVGDGRMKLRPGTHRPGDEVLEHEGRAVLLLDEKIAERLEARTLDVRDTENGPKLRLRRAAGSGS